MSFGFSISDFVLLVRLAHKTFRNCQQAGEEYAEITCEVRCLHRVLRTLRAEAQRPDSKIFKQDPASTAQLLVTTDGCKIVLRNLEYTLAKYEGLKTDNPAGLCKKFWQRFRFGSKVEELGVIRGKLIAYTSSISILIDTMQIQISVRVESKIDGGFAEMTSQFDKMRKEIFGIASHARAEKRMGMTMSSLSLSTYNWDEKVVWQDFRRELVKKGFQSQSLDKYKHVLQAYMLKLDQSGLLDQEQVSNSLEAGGTPWWAQRMFTETINSLADSDLVDRPSSPAERSSDESGLSYLTTYGYNSAGPVLVNFPADSQVVDRPPSPAERSPPKNGLSYLKIYGDHGADPRAGTTIKRNFQMLSRIVEQPRSEVGRELKLEVSPQKLAVDVDERSISSLDSGLNFDSTIMSPNASPSKTKSPQVTAGVPLLRSPSFEDSDGNLEKTTPLSKNLELEWSKRVKTGGEKRNSRQVPSEDEDVLEPSNNPSKRGFNVLSTHNSIPRLNGSPYQVPEPCDSTSPEDREEPQWDIPLQTPRTKINRTLVSLEALRLRNETFEAKDGSVFVQRFVATDEIQVYAEATQIIRALRNLHRVSLGDFVREERQAHRHRLAREMGDVSARLAETKRARNSEHFNGIFN